MAQPRAGRRPRHPIRRQPEGRFAKLDRSCVTERAVIRPRIATVGLMTTQDARFAAALHVRALPRGFFAELGEPFLRVYYATFVSSPHAIALTANSDGVRVGTIVGAVDARAHVRWALANKGWRLATAGAVAMAIRPRLATRFVRTRLLRYARAWWRGRHSAELTTHGRGSAPAVLSHVSVVPAARGRGIGSELVDAFAAAAARAGATRVVLTTLDEPDGAAGFYRRAGWRADGCRFGFDGQRMLAFTLDLPSADR